MNLALDRTGLAWTHAQAEGDILEDVHVLEKSVVLEDESRPAVIGAGVGDVFVVKEDLPLSGIGKFQARDNAQERGFARATGAEQGEQFAVVDIEADLFQCHEFVECLGDVTDLYAHSIKIVWGC